MANTKHQLKNDPSGEAEAVCWCGGWRLITANGPGTETAEQRTDRINQAYQKHLDSAGGETANG